LGGWRGVSLRSQEALLIDVEKSGTVTAMTSTSATSNALGVFSKASDLTNYFPSSQLGHK